ncbi:cytochrome c [Candidimonas sp. SYP-B2681]|uniref:SorU family sulfite dehydrogenase c-type cytochrome subunit n=1 Tax=Candidimonas sp. SYP-B2681 TaxID=2497686 RepID=UPI000F868377|nr:cytochrome c [Candidimonas sp. SYP-B2681]RTZ41535.1 cytochrome c [Candidimonas sp. SYP-B2681]
MRFAVSIAALVVAGVAGPCMAGGPDTAMLARGKALFQSQATPACAICHTLADAGAAAAVGPNLDELKPDLEQVRRALRDGVGVMPSFTDTLSDEEINAVAEYVVNASKG